MIYNSKEREEKRSVSHFINPKHFGIHKSKVVLTIFHSLFFSVLFWPDDVNNFLHRNSGAPVEWLVG